MITLDMGRRRLGKTTLAYYLAKKKPTVLIFDPRAMFHTTDDILPNADNLFDLLNDRAEIIIQPESNVPASFEATTSELFAWVKENPEEPVSFLVDESFFVDTQSETYEHFDRLLRFCNPKLVDVIMTCHRPKDISVNIRSIADFWCMFHTTQEHDLKVIGERCGEGVVHQISQLKKYQFVVWNDAEGKSKVVTDSQRWKVEISRKLVAA